MLNALMQKLGLKINLTNAPYVALFALLAV